MPFKHKNSRSQLPLFFNKKKLALLTNQDASDDLHDVKEFHHESGSWMVKDINANGRKRYDELSSQTKSLLLQAEMMHSELYNYLSGINGPHYRVIINKHQEVVGLASEKVIKVADFVDWLKKADLKALENQKKLRQYFQLLTAQMMIEDPDPNPYNIMQASAGLVKIDEGWASYPLLLKIMGRPTPFEHEIKDVKSVVAKALATSLGTFPIGRLLQDFLPKFLHSLNYWFVQRQLIMEECKPFFSMDFNTLHAWILKHKSEDSTLLETLITPTLVYHFITEKCSSVLSKKDILNLQTSCHQLIEKGLRQLLDLVNKSLKTWFEKLLMKMRLISIPTAEGLESPAFDSTLFQFTDELLKATKSQVCEFRQLIAKQYDLTLQFQTMRLLELMISLLPSIKSTSSSYMMQLASQLSEDYYLTATHYLLADVSIIERAGQLSRMQPEKIDLFIHYHQKRQEEYRKQLFKDHHYRLYFIKNAAEIKQELEERLISFQSNNALYDDMDLLSRFEKNFKEWHQQLESCDLFSDPSIGSICTKLLN